jgi:hypothetical protein
MHGGTRRSSSDLFFVFVAYDKIKVVERPAPSSQKMGGRWLKPNDWVASSSKLTVSGFNERKRAAALKLDRGGSRASATPYLRITSHLGVG